MHRSPVVLRPFPHHPIEHSPDHLNCPACAKAEQMHSQYLSASMSFSEAAEQYLADHRTIQDNGRIRYVAARTLEDWTRDLSMAVQFFGPMPLNQIQPYHFASYQQRRSVGEGFVRRIGGRRKGWTEVPTAAGPAIINDELDMVRRVMEDAGVWTPQHTKRYHKLQEPDSDVERALSPEETEHFLVTARRDPETHAIWWYSLMALDLGFSSDEMMTLRQGDISTANEIVSVNPKYGKNGYRRRTVPMITADCKWAAEQLIRRSAELPGPDGAPLGYGPGIHLFPERIVRGRYNPERPIGRGGMLRPLFRTVRERAGLEWFCINGWRHTAATRMAEAGVPIAIVMERLGHLSPKMTRHYTHISEQAQRRALQYVYQPKRRPPQRDSYAGSAAPFPGGTLSSWGAPRGPEPIRSFFLARSV